MTDAAPSHSRDSRLTPESVAGRTFSSSKRGYAEGEVRAFLRLVADDLGEPEGGLEPVLDRVAVPKHSRDRLDDAERSEQNAELDESVPVLVDDALLDRLPDRVRHQGLRDHPDDPEEDRDRDRRLLMQAYPDEEPGRRAGIRSPRIGDR